MVKELLLNRSTLLLGLGEKKNLKPYCVFGRRFILALKGGRFSHAGAASRLCPRSLRQQKPGAVESLLPAWDIP